MLRFGWKGKHYNHECFCTFSFFLKLLLLSMLYSLKYPFDQFGSAVCALSHPNLLPTSLPTGLCNGCCWRGNLDVVPAQFSISQNIKTFSALSIQFDPQFQSTVQAGTKKINFMSSRCPEQGVATTCWGMMAISLPIPLMHSNIRAVCHMEYLHNNEIG